MKRSILFIVMLTAMLCLIGATGYAAEFSLPVNIKTVGIEAFYGDRAIGTEIILPEGLQRIEARAFANTGIRRIYLPRSLTYIAPDAFQGCSLTAWGDYYSYGRTYCVNNNIPFDSGTQDPTGYFTYAKTNNGAVIMGYTGPDSDIVIPRKFDSYYVTGIGPHAFGDTIYNDYGNYPRCTQYTSVSIPDTVTTIGEGAFLGCTGLKFISLPTSVRTIGKNAFKGCTGLKTVGLNEGLTEIRRGAFMNCSALTEIRLPGTLGAYNDTDHYEQFRDCTSLRRLTVAEGVTALSGQMFQDCTSLAVVTLPDSLENFNDCFINCTSITHIRIPRSMTTANIGGIGIASISDIELHAGVEELSVSSPNLVHVVIPDTLKRIGLVGGSNTVSFYIPDSVDLAYYRPFIGFRSLREVRLPDRWTSLDTQFFSGCTSLETVNLPAFLESLPYLCFQNCTSLTSLVIPDGVANVGADAFQGCTALRSLTIPRNATLSGDFSVFPNLRLVVHSGSAAEAYAVQNGLAYDVMDPPAEITAQPVDVRGEEGATATFTVAAQNATAYRWQASNDGGSTWTDLSATTTAYSVTIDAASAARRYRCAVTGKDGNVVYSDSVRIIMTVVGDSVEIYSVVPSVSQAYTDENVTFTIRTSLNITDVCLVARSENCLWQPYDYSAIWRMEDCAEVSGGELVWSCEYAFPYSGYDDIHFYALGAVRDNHGGVSTRKTDSVYPDIEILPLEMEDVIELSSYFHKSLQEASALTQCAIAQHFATDDLPSEWCTWNGGVHMASRDMSPFRVQYIRLNEEDMTHSLFGINNDMTLSQKRSTLIDQGWSQGRNEFVYVSPDDNFEMVVHEDTIEASWTDDAAFAFVQSTGVTMAFDQEEYTVIGTGLDSMETLTLKFSLYGWEYLNDSFRMVYSANDLTMGNAFDDQAGSINEAYFTVQGKKSGTFNVSVQYYVAGKLYATATTRVRVITDPSTLEHTDVSALFGKRMDKLSEEFPTHEISLFKFLNQSEDLASQFRVDWRYHNLYWGSRLAPNGTGGYYVDMILIPYNDYYHSLYGIYNGMAEADRKALLEANGWVRQSDADAIGEYMDATYINNSLGRIIEWDEFTGIYCYMTPSAAAALNVPSGITMFAMPRLRTVTRDAEGTNRAEVMVWFASKDANAATISALPNECMSGSKFTTVGLDTTLFSGGSAGSGPNTGRWMYYRLKGLGSGQITIRYTDATYGTHEATTVSINIVAENSWA